MIVTAPNSSYCLSSMAALRESQSLKSTFTKTHAERVLDTFVARGWLHKSKFVPQLIMGNLWPGVSPLNRYIQEGEVLSNDSLHSGTPNLHHEYLPERYSALHRVPRDGLPWNQVLYPQLRGHASQSLLRGI